jgi:hypothetical protein
MKAPHTRGFCFPDALHFVQCARVWNRFLNSQTKRPPSCCLARHQSVGRAPRFGSVVRLTWTRLRKRPGNTGQSRRYGSKRLWVTLPPAGILRVQRNQPDDGIVGDQDRLDP